MTTIRLRKLDGMYYACSTADSILLEFIANNSIALNKQGLFKAQIVVKALGWKIEII